VSPIRSLSAAAALVAALTLPAAAFAQQAPAAPPAAAAPAPGMQRHHGAYLSALKQVNLSDAQRQQIRAAMLKTRQANQNADPDTRRANRQALRAQIDGIMTPDQRTQFHTALRQARRNARAAAPANPPPHG
jgi:Spy/CpxP family protein refolding chaperone